MAKSVHTGPEELAERERLLALREEALSEREARIQALEQQTVKLFEQVRAYRTKAASQFTTQIHSVELAGTAARFWNLIRPKDVDGHGFVRVGRAHDGGYVMLDDFFPEQVAYSFGINDDTSWDRDMAARGIHVHMYDPSISTPYGLNDLMHFWPHGVCGEGRETEAFFTLATLLERNGHAGHENVVLKMDVEGAEWNSLITLPDGLLQNMSQMTFELHGFGALGERGGWADLRLAVLEKLRQFHEPVHIHANNNSTVHYFGGYPVPETLEITYVRRRDYTFSPCSRSFPTALDSPNTVAAAEIILSRHLFES